MKGKYFMHFEKVSREEFINSIKFLHNVDKKYLNNMYDNIILPKRSTDGSIGYDFFMPFGVNIKKHENIIVPTGIRAVDMKPNVGLFMFPRSGLGFKYRLSLVNTVGIIDSDYMNADNEGHILIKISFDGIPPKSTYTDLDYENDTRYVRLFGPYLYDDDRPEFLELKPGSKFCQGIFIPCMFVDYEEEITNKRTGGFGSTDERK
jgi:dUTP pyrophosphatase